MKAAGRFVGPAVVLGIYVAIAAGYVGKVPIWDGRQYLDHLQKAVQGPFDPMAFNIFGHPSMAYFLLLGASQAPDPGNLVLLGLANLLLGAGVLWAFSRIVRHLFPDAGATEAWLLVALLAVHPAFHACMANLNADFGVLVWFVPLVLALLRRRYGWAALAGTGLVLSKESGIVLFGLSLAGHALIAVLAPPGRPVQRLRRLARLLPLALPFAAVAGFFALRASHPEQSVLWGNQEAGTLLGALFRVDADRLLLANLLVVFVLQFQWVLTLAVPAWFLVRRPWTPAKGADVPADDALPGAGPDDALAAPSRPADARPAADVAARRRREDLAFVCFVFVTSLYVLTRFRTFVNARYFLPLFPLWLLLCAAAIRDLSSRLPRVRIAFLALLAGLFLLSTFRTVDPVSKAAFGTFPFGRHDLLDMTSVTGEFAGFGRDQLVYNLEFLQIGRLEDRFFQDVKPTTKTVILMHRDASWFTAGLVDRNTLRRTVVAELGYSPAYADVMTMPVGAFAPDDLWYLDLPNHPDHAMELQILEDRGYALSGQRVYEDGGYALTALHYARPGTGAAPATPAPAAGPAPAAPVPAPVRPPAAPEG